MYSSAAQEKHDAAFRMALNNAHELKRLTNRPQVIIELDLFTYQPMDQKYFESHDFNGKVVATI